VYKLGMAGQVVVAAQWRMQLVVHTLTDDQQASSRCAVTCTEPVKPWCASHDIRMALLLCLAADCPEQLVTMKRRCMRSTAAHLQINHW
jgi:hypothetical protein